jgi:hypothetical protein
LMSECQQEFELEGWKSNPIPSTDSTYEVFHQVGWDRREILAATSFDHGTCARCRHSARAMTANPRLENTVLTIAKPCATYDVHEQAVRFGRWEAPST